MVGLKFGIVVGFSMSSGELESKMTSPEGLTIQMDASTKVPIASICRHTDSHVISLL